MSSPLRTPTVITAFVGAGVTLKLADHLGEERANPPAYVCAIASGTLLGVLINAGAEESSYVFGILLGVGLARKIDRLNLWAGLVTTLGAAALLGFAQPLVWLILLVSALSLLDEIGHDHLGERADLLGVLFRHRGALKLGTALLGVASMISQTTTIGFLGFDLAYEAVAYLIQRKSRQTTRS